MKLAKLNFKKKGYCPFCRKDVNFRKQIGHTFCNNCNFIIGIYPKETKKLKINSYISEQIVLR